MVYLVVGLTIALIILALYTIKLQRQDRQVIALNIEAQQQNEQLDKEIALKRQQLENTKITVQAQENILQSITKTAETLRQSAEERAEESYRARVSALEEEYRNKENLLAKEMENVANRVVKEQKALDDLKAKQLAYIQAQQREEELKAQADYYRLVLSNEDKQDITSLRNVQIGFHHKDAIDKVIWEVYYRPAYDVLTGHLFGNNNGKTCGIYRIVDITNGQGYIGQSVDIKERFRQHIKTSLSNGPATNKLYQQMKNSGQDNFIFEVLEEVPREKLNERETYWIDFYKTKEYGLNKTAGGA